MNIELNADVEKVVRKRVKAGPYRSADEVINEALRLLDLRDRARSREISKLHKRIDATLVAPTGHRSVDGERFMKRLLSALDAPPAKKK